MNRAEAATITATYTEEGRILIDGREIDTFDADGGEWLASVDAILASNCYQRTADWDGDNTTVIEVPVRFGPLA